MGKDTNFAEIAKQFDCVLPSKAGLQVARLPDAEIFQVTISPFKKGNIHLEKEITITGRTAKVLFKEFNRAIKA